MKKKPETWKNQLYFGDCLEIMQDMNNHNKEGFIDLIYIDPPFNSKRNYNILFENVELTGVKAQKEAFADTWSNVSYMDTLNQLSKLDLSLYNFLKNLSNSNISKSAISYLVTMAIRIWYMQKVLKPTGSFYLHCDPTMSHYLKILCDLIFGEKNFRNEISWKRSQPKSHAYSNFANCRDVILRYTKSNNYLFKRVYGEHDQKYIEDYYKYTDSHGRRYSLADLTNPNKDRPNLTYEFLGVTRVWRWTKDRMEKAYTEGRIMQSKPGQVPRFISYYDEKPGQPLTDDWDDIEHLHGSNKETLGFPTQKPIKLLERILQSSSNEGDIVADFFCGCGTTITAAQKLKRSWIGVDISHLAIGLIERRLLGQYGSTVKNTFEIHGFPKDIASARQLSENTAGRFEFQNWIIEAKLGGVVNPKKTADGGWDGHLTFDIQGNRKLILVEVKSGNVNVKNVREFIQVVTKANADIGVFVCFRDQVTKPMQLAAKEQGYFMETEFLQRFDKIKILTVEDLLDNRFEIHPISQVGTFKKASQTQEPDARQIEIF